MSQVNRTPSAHAEAFVLASAALELGRSADWLDWFAPDSDAWHAIRAALDEIRVQLAPIAQTLSDSLVMSERDPMAARVWWTCPCCDETDAALMRSVDALGRAARDFSDGALSTLPGSSARADMLGTLMARVRVLVACPDCHARVPGLPACTVLDRDSQRRPRKPKAVR